MSDSDWSRVFGVPVQVTPDTAGRSGDRPPPWRGVVLPPAADTAPGRVRIGVSHHPDKPPAPGDVVEVDPGVDEVDPNPTTVEDRLRRAHEHSRGPTGLPLIYGDIPRTALATASELRSHHRRKPARGQRMIAQYYVPTRSTYIALFAIADSEELPAASDRRATVLKRARTCVRCTEEFDAKLPISAHFSERYCPGCESAVAWERWRAARKVERTHATRWARSVLDSRMALWLHSTQTVPPDLFIGDLETERTLVHFPVVTFGDHADASLTADQLAHAAGRGHVVPLLERYQSHRFIGWDAGADTIANALHMRHVYGASTLTVSPGDRLRNRLARWLAVPLQREDGPFDFSAPYIVTADLDPHPETRLHQARALVVEMAEGEPTEARRDAARASHEARGYLPAGFTPEHD
jgi:hypothetical protein